MPATSNTPRPKAQKQQKQTNDNTTITVEEIKCIFQEMFRKHEENITSIISSNNILLNQRFDILSKEIGDIKDSLQFFQNETEDKINDLTGRINELENKIKEKPSWVVDIEGKLVEIEDRSRRNNLRFDGLAESQGESWEQTSDKIYRFIEGELDIDCSNVIIERAHRTGRHREGKPRAVVAKFLNYNDKIAILRNCKNLKGTPFCVYEDFSKETVTLRKELWKTVLANRQKGKVSYLNYRSVVCRDV